MDKTEKVKQVFDQYAIEYQNRFMDVGLYHDTFDSFCKYIPKRDASILEIACGPGNITSYLLAQRPDFDLLGLDIAPQMIDLARQNVPSASFDLMDARQIRTIDQSFDGIMCGFCLPYLSQEEALQLIEDAHALLHVGGILYLSTMEDSYSKSGLQRSSSGEYEMYMYYHEAETLLTGLKQGGFEMIEVQRKLSPGQEGTTTRDLVLLAQKC